MEENTEQDPKLVQWEDGERLLTRTFEVWRAEFRQILEDHRREIRDRLEKIEREIEKKSDKENVELLARSIQDELNRHTEDIKSLYSGLNEKLGIDTMWKMAGVLLALGSALGGIVGFVVHLLLKR